MVKDLFKKFLDSRVSVGYHELYVNVIDISNKYNVFDSKVWKINFERKIIF